MGAEITAWLYVVNCGDVLPARRWWPAFLLYIEARCMNIVSESGRDLM